MTTADLGRSVKRLHAKAYDHVDDAVLGRAMMAKFPGMYSHATDAQPRNLDANTIPETPRTLLVQLQQLAQGIRRVVFIARGSKVHPNPADFGARKLTLPSGEFYYKPDAIKPQEIIAAVRDHRLNEILGSASEGYGAPSKENLHGPVQSVMSRDRSGETVQGALSDQQHIPQAISAAKAVTPPGGKVSLEPPQNEIANRLRPRAGGRWPKPQAPRS